MPTRTSRRTFMQLSTAALAVSGSARSADLPIGRVAVWVTAGAKRHAEEPSLFWLVARPDQQNVIRIDPLRRFQDLLGFGGAFTEAACHMFNRLDPAVREKLLQELFDPATGLGLSVGRTCIGSSDYATTLYSYDDGDPDPELTRFSIEHDRADVLPILRQARKINPNLFLLGSPWSPPGWMKANNSMLGGSMRKKYYAPYANYFVKYLKAYAAEGVVIDAITSQNEVDTDQDGRMPACLWGQEYEMEFIAKHLGPQLAANDLKTKIWIIDHNYNLWGRAICELDDREVSKFVDGVAWHGYAGDEGAMTRVHDAHPSKHAYWTEGGPDVTSPDYLTDWAKWGTAFAGILRNWSRAIIAWNLALDEKGRPNIGPFPCGGVVTINSATKEIIRSGQFWALAHYSRAIRRGAKRIDSAGEIKGVSHVAAVNPDGSTGVVLTNTTGRDTTVNIAQWGKTAQVALPAGSVTSLMWR